MNYIQITEDNRDSFLPVLPEGFPMDISRVYIGSYDEEGYVTGAVAIRPDETEYVLEWIYVAEKARGKYTGAGLMGQVFRFVENVGLMPLSALFEDPDGSLSAFFEAVDPMYHPVTIQKSHDRFYGKTKDFYSSPFLNLKKEFKITPGYFLEEPVRDQRKLVGGLGKLQIDDYAKWKRTCVPELCRTLYSKNRLQAVILINRRTDNLLELSYLYGKNVLALYNLLCTVARELKEKFPKDKIIFDTVSEAAYPLAKKLFEKGEQVEVLEASWMG